MPDPPELIEPHPDWLQPSPDDCGSAPPRRTAAPASPRGGYGTQSVDTGTPLSTANAAPFARYASATTELLGTWAGLLLVVRGGSARRCG
jgi:hypothetical protein